MLQGLKDPGALVQQGQLHALVALLLTPTGLLVLRPGSAQSEPTVSSFGFLYTDLLPQDGVGLHDDLEGSAQSLAPLPEDTKSV